MIYLHNHFFYLDCNISLIIVVKAKGFTVAASKFQVILDKFPYYVKPLGIVNTKTLKIVDPDIPTISDDATVSFHTCVLHSTK